MESLTDSVSGGILEKVLSLWKKSCSSTATTATVLMSRETHRIRWAMDKQSTEAKRQSSVRRGRATRGQVQKSNGKVTTRLVRQGKRLAKISVENAGNGGALRMK